ATGGHDADDRIIYNTTTGQLFYDADGNGAGAAQLFATLAAGTSVAARQIVVVNAPGLVINGTPGNDSLVGTTSNDTLNGFGGNDTLDGGIGTDSMVGGDGNDVYIVDNVGDAVVESPTGGVDELRTGLSSYTLPDSVENLTLLGSAFLGYGNALNNVMRTSDTQHGELHGGAGDDTLISGAAGGTLYGDGGNDQLIGSSLGESFIGGTGDDTILAGDGDDQIEVYFDSSTGSSFGHDVVDGGAGIDWLSFDPSLGAVTVDLAAGTASNAQGSITLSNIEYVVGTNGNDSLTGNSADNRLIGGVGGDTLNGGAGNDMLIGGEDRQGFPSADTFVLSDAAGAANADNLYDFGTGVDTIQLDARVMSALGVSGRFSDGDVRFFAGAGATSGHDADDRIIYNTSTGELFYDADGSGAGSAQLIATLGAIPVGGTHPTNPLPLAATDILVVNGAPTGQMLNGTAGNDTLVGGAGNDTLNGFGGNDSLLGNEGADSLSGGDGNDTLDASVGFHGDDGAIDTLDGGLGDDVYWVSSDGDIIVPDPGGIDTVRAHDTSWTLGAGLENLDLVDDRGAAYSGTGNELNNTILGATEGGPLSGLGGDDLLVARNTQNTTGLSGGDGNDTLDGRGWHTIQFGDAGDDLLLSGGGDDTMTGGAGADTFRFTTAGDAVVSDFASGTDKLSFDGKAFTAIGASGNFSAGDARFFAGTAAHDADDRIIFDAATGNLWYDADGNGGGAAVIVAHVTGNVVATDIAVINGTAGQTINGTSGNDSLVGGAGNDTINGLGGNDTIDGGTGADSMVGGPGDDLYFVDNPGDIIVEQNLEGFDEVRSTASSYTLSDWINNLTLLSGAGNGTGNAIDNVITGNGAANGLSGGDGNDTLIGAGGNDTFSGGNGADAYVFNAAPGTANAGLITDFTSTTDVIRLDGRAMTAIGPSGTFASGDARFYAAAGANGGHDADDRVVYNITTGQLWYDADGSGSGAAQLIATLQGAPALAATDIAVDNGSSAPPPPPPGSIVGTAGNDTMPGTAGNDSMFGLGGNDVMAGGSGNDSIVGGAGNDTIYGDSNNDWIEGGAGNDSLSGGGDQDSYVFREYGAANADTVGDFASAWDMLRFDGTAFGALGGAGHFAAGDARFYAAAGASGGHDADDRIVYNISTGQLFYDADGSGAGAAQLVATIQGAPGVAAGDIWVI
ncbi:MAG TPA: hypothetical protein VFA72_22865, partial [Burkholderiales bacterium]|nr:hypothetical protein [Burkholderiales bacterium]